MKKSYLNLIYNYVKKNKINDFSLFYEINGLMRAFDLKNDKINLAFI